VSTQTPSQIRPFGPAHPASKPRQLPLTQVWPAAIWQTVPQPPQCWLSLETSVQMPLQRW
jgi:hypothetical protein